MSSDHMIFLAGRKEYDNHSKRLHSSSDLTTLPEGSLLQESFERALSTSMSMSIDDVNSVHSFGSEASDLSYSETKTVQQAFSNLHTGFNNSDMQEERKTTGVSCVMIYNYTQLFRMLKLMGRENHQNCY